MIRLLIIAVVLFFSISMAILSFGCGRAPSIPKTDVRSATPSPVSQPAGPSPVFVDISARAGIQFRQQNSGSPKKYMLETMGSGCAFIDYDGDGWPDILLLNGTLIPGGHVQGNPTMKLYRNNHDLTFTDVTRKAGLEIPGMYAMGCAVGDYDNDGKQDLYVTCVLGPSRLFHNEGGRFREVTKQAGVGNERKWGTSCAWLDYDKDGKLDLFVCNYVKYESLADHRPCYAGEYKPVYCAPSAYDTIHCTLYHNEGNGRFTDVTDSCGIGAARGKSLGVTVWDYDKDGWPDIFVANDTAPGFLFHNMGNGKFTEIGVESGVAYDDEGNAHSGMGIDADDVSNDGKMAVVITNFQGEKTSFYHQTRPGFFHDDHFPANLADETAQVLGFGVLFFDYDNDGWKDILQVNGHVQDDVEEREPNVTHAQPTLLFRNLANGTFAEVGKHTGSPFKEHIVGRGCAWGDVDHDGRMDILITTNNGPVLLWHNETPLKNHWLTVKLEGVKTNRNGIGAQIIASAPGLRQRTLVRSGSSYLSQSELCAHFGLGASDTVDLEVHWPAGTIDRIAHIATDRIVTVVEGSGAAK